MNTEDKHNLPESNDNESIKNHSKFKGKVVAFFKNNKAGRIQGPIATSPLIS